MTNIVISEEVIVNLKEEYEVMLELKLFNQNLTEAILQQRLEYAEKIINRSTNYTDLKDLLLHEIKLLQFISVKRTNLKILDKKDLLENKIIARIKCVYKELKHFKQWEFDYSINEEYFKFCKSFNRPGTLSIIEHMMLKFSHVPKLYVLMSDWSFSNKDFTKACNIIQEGVNKFPKEHYLYVAAFNMDLNQIKSVFKEKPPTNQRFGNNIWDRKIKEYVDLVLKNITKFEHYVEILNIIDPFDFAFEAYNKLLEYLYNVYPHKKEFWEICVLREKQGYHFSTSNEDINKENKFESRTKYQILNCVQKYEQGLSLMSVENRAELWAHYLNFLMELFSKKSLAATETKKKVCKEGFEKAAKQNMLKEAHFEKLVQLVEEEEKEKYLIKGIETFPKNITIWQAYLQYGIMKKNQIQIHHIFKNAILALGNESLPIWKLMYRYHLTISESKTIKQFFEMGIKEEPCISDTIKALYLDWVSEENGIEAARALFKEMGEDNIFGNGQYPKNVLNEMISLESYNPNSNTEFWLELLNLGTQQFSDDPEFWQKNIEFYFIQARKNDDKQKCVTSFLKVYNESLQNLPKEKHEEFKNKNSYIIQYFDIK